MNLPPQIQRQLDQAEAMLAQANQPAASQPVAEPVVEPQVAPQPQPTPVEPAVEPVVQPSAPVAPVQAGGSEETWERRYRTLQGFHKQNISDLKRRLEEANDRNQELTAKVERLSSPKTEPTLDPKHADVFGADLVEMVKQVAESMFMGAAQAFERRLELIEQHLKGTVAATAKTADEVFMERLLARVPDFEAVNTSEGFLSWLEEIDPVYGLPRQNALTAAGDARDVDRVAAIFNAYKATIKKPAEATATTKLDKQVSPRSSGASQTPVPQREVFTVAEVQAFYRDVQRGAYRGREAEAERLEEMFNAALAEGRIVDRAPPRVA